LALSVVGGLVSSTFLSLFLVPVMFVLFAKPHPESDEEEEAGGAPAEVSSAS
jgi:Cu/Ag efflux pump CusA